MCAPTPIALSTYHSIPPLVYVNYSTHYYVHLHLHPSITPPNHYSFQSLHHPSINPFSHYSVCPLLNPLTISGIHYSTYPLFHSIMTQLSIHHFIHSLLSPLTSHLSITTSFHDSSHPLLKAPSAHLTCYYIHLILHPPVPSSYLLLHPPLTIHPFLRSLLYLNVAPSTRSSTLRISRFIFTSCCPVCFTNTAVTFLPYK